MGGDDDKDKKKDTRDFNKMQERELLFRRAELFHKELMEDFRFMEAARMHSGEYEANHLNSGHLYPRSRYRELMLTTPQALVNFVGYSHQEQEKDSKDKKRIVDADMRSLRFGTRMATHPPLSIFAHWLLNSRGFVWLMIIVILGNSVLIAFDMEIENKTPNQRKTFELLDFICLMIFVMEIILRWVDDFRGFWREGWSWFDFTITSVSLVAPILDLVFDEETLQEKEEEFETLFLIVKYLRIVRIFRSLNVVTRIRKIRLIWEVFLKTFQELLWITILMLIFFYIFAIIGIRLFDKYTLSHTPNLKYRDSFKDIPHAFVTLFQLFTLDHYAELLDELIQEVGYTSSCSYVLLWIFLGNLIFFNLFTGVLVYNFTKIRQSLLQEEKTIEDHKNLAMKMNIFGDDDDKKEKESDDPHLGWEDEVFQNMQVIDALGNNLSPTVWPRDTLFQYYIILEALASNVEEKRFIFRQLDDALLRNFDQ